MEIERWKSTSPFNQNIQPVLNLVLYPSQHNLPLSNLTKDWAPGTAQTDGMRQFQQEAGAPELPWPGRGTTRGAHWCWLRQIAACNDAGRAHRVAPTIQAVFQTCDSSSPNFSLMSLLGKGT